MPAIELKKPEYKKLEEQINNDLVIKYIDKRIIDLYDIFIPKIFIYPSGETTRKYPKEFHEMLENWRKLKNDRVEMIIKSVKK